MKNSPTPDHLAISARTEKEFDQEFQSILHAITQMKGIRFVVATNNQNIARMEHGKTSIFFNPKFTYEYITSVVKEQGSDFVLQKGHILQILVHEIGHMVEYGQLVADTTRYTITPKPRWVSIGNEATSALALRESLLNTYGEKRRHFENMIRDIRVDKRSADLKQATSLHSYMVENYLVRTIPTNDFTAQTLPDGTIKTTPYGEQFSRAVMKGMATGSWPKVDPVVQSYIENNQGVITEAGTVRKNNAIHTLPMRLNAMIKLFDVVLELEKIQEKEKKEKQEKEKKENEQQGGENNTPSEGQGTPKDAGSSENNPGQSTPGEGKNADNSGDNPGQSTPSATNNPGANQPSGPQGQQQATNASSNGSGEQKNTGQPTPRLMPHLLEEAGINCDPQATLGKPTAAATTPPNTPPSPTELDALRAQLAQNALPQTEKDKRLEQEFAQTFGLNPQDPAYESKKEELLDRTNDSFTEKFTTFEEAKAFLLEQMEDRETIKQILEGISDSQGRNVVNFITHEILERIQTIKQSTTPGYRGPVKRAKSNGHVYTDEIVNLFTDNQQGDAAIREQTTKKEKEKKELFGFEFDLIGDGSYSMTEGTKNYDQRINLLLAGYALSRLQEEIDYAGIADISIFSSCSLFSGGTVHTLRDRSNKLTTKEFLVANHLLKIASSSTGDFVAMQQYLNNLKNNAYHGHTPEEHEGYLAQIQKQYIKKILLLMSDGGSDNATKMRKEIAKARALGVIACGIGITAAGSPILGLFGTKQDDPLIDKLGRGEVCTASSDLGSHIQELLIQHLEASV